MLLRPFSSHQFHSSSQLPINLVLFVRIKGPQKEDLWMSQVLEHTWCSHLRLWQLIGFLNVSHLLGVSLFIGWPRASWCTICFHLWSQKLSQGQGYVDKKRRSQDLLLIEQKSLRSWHHLKYFSNLYPWRLDITSKWLYLSA